MEEVEAGKEGRTDIKKYLGMVINGKGDLEEHIKEKGIAAKALTEQIRTIGLAKQCGTESHRVRLELYQKCAYPSDYYGLHAWGRIKLSEIKALEKLQSEMLKQILDMSNSTSCAGILMET